MVHSKEAATYDTRHETALSQINEKIRDRLDFLGVGWASDDDEDTEDDEGRDAPRESKKPAKSVRLLDYACGTGTISRVITPPDTCTLPACWLGQVPRIFLNGCFCELQAQCWCVADLRCTPRVGSRSLHNRVCRDRHLRGYGLGLQFPR